MPSSSSGPVRLIHSVPSIQCGDRQPERRFLDLILAEQNVLGCGAEWHKTVLACDPMNGTDKATFHECRDDTFADTATVSRLVDDQDPAGRLRCGQDVHDR